MPERLDARQAHPTPRPHARLLPVRRPGTSAAPTGSGSGLLLRLQRIAGNRAVAALLQRVEVKDKPYSETLYNQSGTGGKAKAKDYGLTPSYVLTRNGDSGLT